MTLKVEGQSELIEVEVVKDHDSLTDLARGGSLAPMELFKDFRGRCKSRCCATQASRSGTRSVRWLKL